MKMKSILWVLFLACCMTLVNCTEAPPLPPGGETKTPGETRLPGETGPPPLTLKSAGHTTLPRKALAVFVHQGTSFACTPEGSLYNKKIEDIRKYRLTAVDLVSGKLKWTQEGTACVFRVVGDSVFSLRDLSDAKDQVVIERLNAKTGQVEATFTIGHSGCMSMPKSGPGERMFSTVTTKGLPCFVFSIHGDKLQFVNQRAVQLFDVNSGKSVWNEAIPVGEGRVVSALLHQDTLFILEGTKTLAKGATAPPTTNGLKDGVYKFQLRAVSISTKQTKWAIGPFSGSFVQGHIAIKGDTLVVQAVSSLFLIKEDTEDPLAAFAGRTWSGYAEAFAFSTSGKVLWSASARVPVKKSIGQSAPTLVAPIFVQGGALLQTPGLLRMVSMVGGNKLWQQPTFDDELSHAHLISNEHLHLRSSQGKATLLKLIPKKAPEVTRGNDVGSLLYAADGIAPEVGAAKTDTKAGPKRRYSAAGYCLKFNGDPVPMEQVPKNKTAFFLPPSNFYYTPGSFFNAFCASYLIDVEAYELNDKGTHVWKSRALVAEAPVFYFVRGSILYMLSDNGDWYMFRLTK